ncbi:MAG: glycosyltransferase N-terminal domain-containing protein [Gemmatimonadota bacterium]|nr:MAG: glycosyltransferase N-terminal domain-containing protein [Gemmatimonadota bacterium]
MSLSETLYASTVGGLKAASPLLAWGSSKLARGLRARRHAVEILADWAAASRDPDRHLVWFHAASVGEALQARTVMEVLQERRPDLQMVFTHFSPSAEAIAVRMPVDVAGYLPWDIADDARAALDALRPSLLVFTQKEVWPTLTSEAARAGVGVALVAATLPEGAGRMRKWAWPVIGPALAKLDLVAAIDASDGERFLAIGARPGAVRVTGDPGVDSAWARASAADPCAPHLAPFQGDDRPTVVAGSTWEADEVVLLSALRSIRAERAALRLVIAPHEPTQATVQRLATVLAAAGWHTATLGEVERDGDVGDTDAIVVDRVGVLADLYSVGRVAYVGGGFHAGGLHNVLEPAAAGRPTLIGPQYANSRAAADLVQRGGVVTVHADGLGPALANWLDDSSARARAERAAADYVLEHRGAAERTVDLLEDLF